MSWRSLAAAAALGPLERELLEVLWASPAELCVRDVQCAIGERIAYTTAMTTLDRLFKKGLLERRKDGRAFFYRPRTTRAELEGRTAGGLIRRLLGSLGGERAVVPEARPILSSIVDAVGENDRELLDELERLVRAKKERLAGEEER